MSRVLPSGPSAAIQACRACLTVDMLTEINLVVEDLAVSRSFYTAMGWTLRSITFPGSDEPQAWLTTSGPAPVTLHSRSFASWWDSSQPESAPGSITLDLTFDDPSEAAQFLGAVQRSGGAVVAESRPMPWGQTYAIVTDPDGYRWEVKAPTT